MNIDKEIKRLQAIKDSQETSKKIHELCEALMEGHINDLGVTITYRDKRKKVTTDSDGDMVTVNYDVNGGAWYSSNSNDGLASLAVKGIDTRIFSKFTQLLIQELNDKSKNLQRERQ